MAIVKAAVRRRNFVWATAALCILGSVCTAPIAATNELRVVIGEDSPAQRQILQALRGRYPGLQVGADVKAMSSRNGPAVYVALGPAALQAALKVELDGPIISLFSSSQAYTALLAAAGRNRGRASITAIFAEASPAHQMQLIARLCQRRVAVGVLLSSVTAYLEPDLRKAAHEAGLDLEIERIASDENVVRALLRVSQASVLLAVPDPRIYTAENMRNVLESTYRRNQPVIGFSEALVKAGTLATVYSDIDDTLAQLDEVLESVSAGRMPEAQFPRFWRVAINESVARSMNVAITEAVRTLGNRPMTRTK